MEVIVGLWYVVRISHFMCIRGEGVLRSIALRVRARFIVICLSHLPQTCPSRSRVQKYLGLPAHSLHKRVLNS
jgi:hypothetical protein